MSPLRSLSAPLLLSAGSNLLHLMETCRTRKGRRGEGVCLRSGQIFGSSSSFFLVWCHWKNPFCLCVLIQSCLCGNRLQPWTFPYNDNFEMRSDNIMSVRAEQDLLGHPLTDLYRWKVHCWDMNVVFWIFLLCNNNYCSRETTKKCKLQFSLSSESV